MHKYETAVELQRGTLGVLNAGRGPGRLLLLRRIEKKPPWDGASLALLADSAERARGIHNPRVLAVIDAVLSADSLLIATEYVEGVTLSTLMMRSRKHKLKMPIPAAVRIATEIARALDAAHEILEERNDRRPLAGLHPECVMISSGDDALLGDLGIVALESIPEYPDLLAYRAPELESKQSTSGQGAAVYSVGVMLWELLAGRDAFGQHSSGASAPAVRKLVREGRLPRLDKVAQDVPSLLVEIVMQAVRRDPSQRFPNLKILADSLVAVAQKAKPGELTRYAQKLCADLVARQKSALILRDVTVASWRPTVHTLEGESTAIPRASPVPGMMSATETPLITLDGKNDLAKLGLPPPPDAEVPAETLKVDMPSAIPASGDGARASLPLLLVNKPSEKPPPPPEVRASATPANVSFETDDFDFQVRRSRFPLIFVFLLLGGATVLAVLAVKNNWFGNAATTTLAVVPASGSTVPAASESGRPLPPPQPQLSASTPTRDNTTSAPRGREPARDLRGRPRRDDERPTTSPATPERTNDPYLYREAPEPAAPAPAPAPAPATSE